MFCHFKSRVSLSLTSTIPHIVRVTQSKHKDHLVPHSFNYFSYCNIKLYFLTKPLGTKKLTLSIFTSFFHSAPHLTFPPSL